MKNKRQHKIILFDGVCNLCNSSVLTIIKFDKNDTFRFAALQSEVAKAIVTDHNIDTQKTDSIILVAEDTCYTRSTAALKIAKHLSKGYPLLYGFIIVPKFIRDWVYDLIARNRYKWYGKKDNCMVPTPELRKKFL